MRSVPFALLSLVASAAADVYLLNIKMGLVTGNGGTGDRGANINLNPVPFGKNQVLMQAGPANKLTQYYFTNDTGTQDLGSISFEYASQNYTLKVPEFDESEHDFKLLPGIVGAVDNGWSQYGPIGNLYHVSNDSSKTPPNLYACEYVIRGIAGIYLGWGYPTKAGGPPGSCANTYLLPVDESQET